MDEDAPLALLAIALALLALVLAATVLGLCS